MFILCVLLLFNVGILFISFVWLLNTFTTVTSYQYFLCFSIATLTVISLAFLFNSRAGQWLLYLLSGARPAITREKQKLEPIIEHVQQAIQITHNLPPLKVHLMALDDAVLNALALGKHTLTVTRGWYEDANEEEIAGVIAHELGHLHNGDSYRLGIALGVSFTASLLSVVISQTNEKAKIILGGNSLVEAVVILTALATGFLFLLIKFGSGILNLAMLYQGRKQEYAADKFAIKAGFGKGLLEFLEKIKDLDLTGKRSLITRLTETHPPIMMRIDRVGQGLSY